jgi:mannose-6-phosphate isomerase-like protein (cupin superfamily)
MEGNSLKRQMALSRQSSMQLIKTVPKEWGEERWIVNRDYCGKILILKKGYRCSLHHHKIKDETFYVSKGCVLMECDGKAMVMNPGDALLIEPSTKHRFTGLQDSEILEFSTHHEDSDSYRDEVSGPIDLSKLTLPVAETR